MTSLKKLFLVEAAPTPASGRKPSRSVGMQIFRVGIDYDGYGWMLIAARSEAEAKKIWFDNYKEMRKDDWGEYSQHAASPTAEALGPVVIMDDGGERL